MWLIHSSNELFGIISGQVADAGRDTTLCQGLSAIIGGAPVAVGGLEPYNYLWTPGTELSDSIEANSTGSPTATTTYILTVTDWNGCEARDTIVVRVVPEVYAGIDTVMFETYSVIIGGNPAALGGETPYVYQWVPATGLSATNISRPFATPALTTSYILTVTDDNSCVGTDTVTVFTRHLPKELKDDNIVLRDITSFDPLDGWLYFDKDTILITPDTFFVQYKESFGLGQHDSMILLRTNFEDSLFMVHQRYSQYHKMISVENAEYSVHSESGYVSVAHGKLVEGLDIDTSGIISDAEALSYALAQFDAMFAWQDTTWENELKEDEEDSTATYYPKGHLVITQNISDKYIDSNYVLAYRFTIRTIVPDDHIEVFVDANTGDIIRIHSLYVNCSPGNLVTLYQGSSTFSTYHRGWPYNDYILKDDCRFGNIHTKNYSSFRSWGLISNIDDEDNNWSATAERNATSAHWGIQKSFDYYRWVLGKIGTDPSNSSREKRVYVNDNIGGFNAWYSSDENPDYFQFGYGLTELDVIGHEYTHAITRFEADLDYKNEGGALNESFSDIFGTMIERYVFPSSWTWLLGDFIPLKRSLSNPLQYSQPNRYRGQFWYTGSGDNGGVHINSGVQNHWFYLLSQAIGSDKAARIVYRNLSLYMQGGSIYTDARAGSIQAARDLFGRCSNEAYQTQLAWHKVGVGDAPINCVSITGMDYICLDLVNYPTHYKAISNVSGTYNWSSVSGWSVSVSGTQNNTFNVTNISNALSKTIHVSIGSLSADLVVKINSQCELPRCKGCTLREQEQSLTKYLSIREISVFPNPTQNVLNIYIPDQVSGKNEVSIFNFQGQKLKEIVSSSSYITFKIGDFIPSGYYILRIKNENTIENIRVNISK